MRASISAAGTIGLESCRTVILDNGVIRTMDPSLPDRGGARDRGRPVAGGVGMHETALASPERDRPRRPLRPPRLHRLARALRRTWSLAQRQVRLEGTRTLDEAVARVAAARPRSPPGRWLRGLGWRSGDW